MIVFDHVSVRYGTDSRLVLRDCTFTVDDGQLVLVAGRTGSGKSTLLGAINGHVPHFTGGTLSGRVLVEGLDTATHPPRDLAHVVGVVSQDPLAGFVTDTVEEELAYGMEQLAVGAQAMRTRVEETLDILGLADLRRRALRTLSGGQQQRVAIGSVLATGVRVLVLDEPTSALDPVSSEEVLATVVRLVDDLGLTVVIAEHRLERVVAYADRMLLLDGSGQVAEGPTREIMAVSPLVPPVVELGRRAHFPQVPLSVREARRLSGEVREKLAQADSDDYPRIPPGEAKNVALTSQNDEESALTGPSDSHRVHGLATGVDAATSAQQDRESGRETLLSRHPARSRRIHHPTSNTDSAAVARHDGLEIGQPGGTAIRTASPFVPLGKLGQQGGLTVEGLRVAYGRTVVVHDVSVRFPFGAITVMMGRNGSGKSSLLWSLTGVVAPAAGSFQVGDQDLTHSTPGQIRRVLRLVPQSASDLLYLPSVAQECAAADHESKSEPGFCQQLLAGLAPGIDPAIHPRDLSEGQKLCLVLAIQLTAQPQVILLDEPTRGLDYPAKASLAQILTGMAQADRAVGLVTHDVEFAAAVADQIIVLAQGEVIQTGTASEVLGTSALFASQVAKVLYPDRWLTAYQVGQALADGARLGDGDVLADKQKDLLSYDPDPGSER